MTTRSVPEALSLHALQQTFLTQVLPRVEAHGRIYFRHVKDPDRKEEVLAELRGLAWKWFVRLVYRGKDVLQFVSTLATYAARAVHSGRRVCGHERSKDVLSHVARHRHGFAVERLPDFSTLHGNPLDEALHENTVSPVPDLVAFKIDFPAWRLTYADRDRRMIDHLMMGGRTLEVSRAFGLSPSRISQKRREFHDSWLAFGGESAP